MVILVTGSSGQVGQALQWVAPNYPEWTFVFTDSASADITNKKQLEAVFSRHRPQFCINAAAYTAVDKAESEPEKAILINVHGVRNLAEVCRDFDCTLMHLSTDFVFDGTKTTPYTEEDEPNPQSVYGSTKLDGERAIQQILQKYFIIRTSWVYSHFGNNFMKTMLRLAKERDSISVVNDQIGTPTNAVDLAQAMLKIIRVTLYPENLTAHLFGIYNFSNEGQCSWYEFAAKIFEYNEISIDLRPIPSDQFPTAARRPKFSVLDKNKIENRFGISIPEWEKSLKALV